MTALSPSLLQRGHALSLCAFQLLLLMLQELMLGTDGGVDDAASNDTDDAAGDGADGAAPAVWQLLKGLFKGLFQPSSFRRSEPQRVCDMCASMLSSLQPYLASTQPLWKAMHSANMLSSLQPYLASTQGTQTTAAQMPTCHDTHACALFCVCTCHADHRRPATGAGCPRSSVPDDML
eukprot:646639-Pelagomonas_calceolata.AAC.2